MFNAWPGRSIADSIAPGLALRSEHMSVAEIIDEQRPKLPAARSDAPLSITSRRSGNARRRVLLAAMGRNAELMISASERYPAPQREGAADCAIQAGSWRADRHGPVVISDSRDRGTAMRDDAEDKENVALLARKLKGERGAGVIAGTIRADQDGLDTAIDLSVHRCGPWHLLMAGSSLLEQAVE
jgi:hypothetical protein